MDLEIRMASGERGPAHSLIDNTLTFLVRRRGKIWFLPEHRHVSEDEVKLGHIVVGPGGAKLQALQMLHILPGRSRASPSSTGLHGDKYQLEPASGDRVEVIILRHGDIITSPDALDSLACVARAPEVQVSSSATEQAQCEDPRKPGGVQDVPEDETEDEAAPQGTVTEVPVTQTVTQPSKSQPSATPHLPRDKSLVVHETPTTSRVVGVDVYDVVAQNEGPLKAPIPQETIAVTETFSTARTGYSPTSIAQESAGTGIETERKWSHSSPEVRVGRHGRKRQSTEPSPNGEVERPTEGRSVKRLRKTTSTSNDDGDMHHASPLDDIIAHQSRTTYSTKRNNRSKPISDTTLTKPSRSSQRSETATTIAAYEGDPPRVAFSNSGIKEQGQTSKFLRKQGGTYLSTVDEKCNVLCVRDGGLAKTMKVFQAIALGIPIVTDKWLSDSAKADGFLDLSSYKPAVAQQEKEWGFSLEKVWGTAQTPFKGYCIYFTPTLRKTYTNFREIERVCQTAGAEVTTTKRHSKNNTTIVLAAEEDDSDAARMIEEGETCYHKDLVTTSILRGELDLEVDEFKIGAKQAAPSRRKGPRKST